MKAIKQAKLLAGALALLAATTFAGCIINSDGSSPFMPSGYTAASVMTQTQSANASSGTAVTVNKNTKTLVLTGVSGKTIYAARTNPLDTVLAAANTRIFTPNSGISGNASFYESGEDFSKALSKSFAGAQEEDPHAAIYNKAMKALKNFSAAEKSLAPIQASVTNYEVGDTETFYTLEPVKKESFNKLTYKLLVSKDNYNIWVNTADTYYKKDQDAFQTAAEKLGEVFINGYNIVSHIYGEPTSYIYTSIKNGTPSKYANMATYSRTGTKINIMLSEMLKGGVLGFVYHGDSAAHLKATDGSNEGRFLYMDSQTLMENKSQAYSTALHEFSHAISFNMKYFEQNVQWTYWYGEMLAMMCEDMMQNYLDIGDSDAPKGRLPSANCNAWLNGLSGQDSLTYAAAFQLGAWLSRKFGGVKVIRELARNGKVDFDSILAAVETASGKTYTKTSLLQEMAEDLLQEKTDSGFNQDAPTYASDATYTCSYSGGTYTYPLTAINLWNKSYGWADIGGFSNIDGENYISNQSILFSELPVDNIFAEADWSKTAEPTVAYIGPLQLASGAVYANIGPSSNMLFKLGTASSDTVTITFMCQGGYYFGDEITVWAK